MYIEEALRDKVETLLNKAPQNMGHALGITFLSFEKKRIYASMPVNENTIQPFGLLHGGASVALAETLSSIGAWMNLPDENNTAVGIEINANHLRSAREGDVFGEAKPIHIGGKIHVWETEIKNENQQLICISRCTLSIVRRR